jgi:hypothetical protein
MGRIGVIEHREQQMNDTTAAPSTSQFPVKELQGEREKTDAATSLITATDRAALVALFRSFPAHMVWGRLADALRMGLGSDALFGVAAHRSLEMDGANWCVWIRLYGEREWLPYARTRTYQLAEALRIHEAAALRCYFGRGNEVIVRGAGCDPNTVTH